ncbi:hypothetical protein J2S75_003251 [Ancylobacter polymorphus]|uniref:Uncharacterized protein n=1 Tax=Ancylobacter polymorphus TaxID=223390 RepID=A0ABU0BEG8_9HYPH|nr:hypothetical protein [Ancylobacter polymorphus]
MAALTFIGARVVALLIARGLTSWFDPKRKGETE